MFVIALACRLIGRQHEFNRPVHVPGHDDELQKRDSKHVERSKDNQQGYFRSLHHFVVDQVR